MLTKGIYALHFCEKVEKSYLRISMKKTCVIIEMLGCAQAVIIK